MIPSTVSPTADELLKPHGLAIEMTETKKPFRHNKTVRVACAICLGLLPFVLIECLLRLTGVGTPTSYQDPFVGFSQAFPLFELNDKTGDYETSRHHQYFFGQQRFAATKPSGTFRAFCLGGSTILGHPYETETALPKWLELELAGTTSSQHYEVINCGGMSYASYRLIPILEEVLRHDPDLILVMTGHNEFLEDRTYRSLKDRSAARKWIDDTLSSLRMVTVARHATASLRSASEQPADDRILLSQDVDARLDHSSGYASYRRDEQWAKDVQAHFELNLRVMVRLCREAGVPILLVNPGSNLRDCAPFKSEHRSGLTSQQLAAWTDCFDKASSVEVAFPGEALEQYRLAAEIDDQHAQLNYRIARCLDRLQSFDEARDAYVRAKETDVCPLRMLDAMQQSLFDVAKDSSTLVVDAAGLLDQQSTDGIVGFDWYVDQVHPTIRGHQLIAQAVAARLRAAKFVESRGQPWSKQDRRQAYRDHMTSLGDQYLAAGQRRVEWLENWARRDRLRDDTIPLDARGVRDLANTYVEFADYAKANTAYKMALSEDPDAVTALLDRALQLFQSGRTAAAEKVAQLVLDSSSDESTTDLAHVALAVCALDAGRLETAAPHAESARSGSFVVSSDMGAWLDEAPDVKVLFE